MLLWGFLAFHIQMKFVGRASGWKPPPQPSPLLGLVLRRDPESGHVVRPQGPARSLGAHGTWFF